MSNSFIGKKDFFSGSFVGQDDSYHHITTDNPRLIELGLDAFTTGSLYDWLHLKDNGSIVRKDYEAIDRIGADTGFLKEYPNQRFWVHKYSEVGFNGDWPHEVLFTNETVTRDEKCSDSIYGHTLDLTKQFFYHGWRTKGRSGEYVTYATDRVNFHDWTYENQTGGLYAADTATNTFRWADLDAEWFDTRRITGWNTQANTVNVSAPLTPLTSNNSLVHRIIEMNNYARLIKQNKESSTWTKSDLAIVLFINDIKTSKEGCVQWHALPEFLLDIPSNIVSTDQEIDGCEGCSKYEDVYFKLYLFDRLLPKQTKRKIVNERIVVARPPSTAYGWSYKDKDEKGRTPIGINPEPANAVAGEVDLHYNETTGKWEGGTTQVFAIMTEDMAAANQPDLDSFLNDDELTLLSADSGMEVGKGKAMILAMQNGNPAQWMPDFHYTRNCREKDDINKNKKVIVNVVNPTGRSFTRGENVILQKIHGVWIAQFIGESSNNITPADPKWDFTYLMTNSMFFFRNHDWWMNLSTFDELNEPSSSTTKTTPTNYEQSFYWWYYRNKEKGLKGGVQPVAIEDNYARYPDTVKKYARVLNGYMQTTSWDFMGIGIGGTRRAGHNTNTSVADTILTEYDALNENYQQSPLSATYPSSGDGNNGNALSATQFSFNQKNEPFVGAGVGGKANTYPFFGCIFPDGYDGSIKYAELMNEEKDFFIAPKNYDTFGNYEAKTPFFYAAKSPFENLNNVRDADIGTEDAEHQEFGMFPVGEAGSLKHLPADIGTNASPSGVYGQPISNIGIIGELNNYVGQPYFRDMVATYFEKNEAGPRGKSWMHKKHNDDTDSELQQDASYSYNQSAFDIKPVNPLKIEFRPLIQEVYSTFEGVRVDNDGANYTIQWNDSKAYGGERGEFAREGYQFNQAYSVADNKGFTPSLSSYSLLRNPQVFKIPPILDKTNLKEEEKFTLYQAGTNTDFLDVDDDNEYGLRYNKELSQFGWGYLSRSDISHAPAKWFQEPWMEPATGIPAGGVGVIGAIVTIATRDQVQFRTENVLGLDDYVEIGNTWPPSFRGGDYSTMNATQLYARVYQQWPRDQMIYDPRFFVVHHFNPDGDKQKELPPTEENNDANRLYGNATTDLKTSEVDLVVPTYWDNTEIEGDGSAKVYADSTNEELDNTNVNGLTKLRNKAHWRISTQRRGKLLPYSFKVPTIGMQGTYITDVSEDFGFLNGDYVGVLSDRNVDVSQDILIVNRGEGYTENSKFVTEGGSGGGVVLKAIVNSSGGVTGFITESTGLDFSPDDFPRSINGVSYSRAANGFGTPFPDFSIFKVKLVAHVNSKNGSGFVGYMCRGTMVQSPTITDAKPMEALSATGPIKLTPDPPLQREGNTTQSLQLTEGKDTLLKVNPIASTSPLNSNSSKTILRQKYKPNEYDVFLHFHNDISHTRMNNYNQVPDSLEQMCRLEIQTNGSDGGSLQENAQGENLNDSSEMEFGAGNGFANGQGSARGGIGGGGLFDGNGGFFMGGNGNFASR